MAEQSDQELLALFRDSNANAHYAFNLIVKKYQLRLYNHVRRMVIVHDDANDLVQNVFIKVWKHLEGFREDSQLFTWMYRIATNECLAFLKQKRKRYFLPIHDVEAELSQKVSSMVPFDANKLELKLQQAILSLPEKQRLVFNL